MPEPPKITTSLAERIAKLNSTKGQGNQSDKAQSSTSPLGQIKSKISRYEASAVNEAPLIPKGSFGLGAPLTKPERGLDRIRIASLGVSGGEQPRMLLDAVVGPNQITRIPGVPRSISLGSKQPALLESNYQEEISSGLRSASLTNEGLKDPVEQVQESKNFSNITSSQETSDFKSNDQIRDAKDSSTSSEVYDGILEGYPSTPAEDEEMDAPKVSCVDCLELVDLDMLAEHVCKPKSTMKNIDQTESLSADGSEPSQSLLIPSDVPIDAQDDDGICGIAEEPNPAYWGTTKDCPVELNESLPTSIDGCSRHSQEIGIIDRETHEVCSHPQPTSATQNSTQVQAASDNPTATVLQPSTRLSELQSPINRLSSSSSSSSSSATTSQTSRSTKSSFTTNNEETPSIPSIKKESPKPTRPQSSQPAKTSWYDDDDESVECTGYATIVRCSQRF